MTLHNTNAQNTPKEVHLGVRRPGAAFHASRFNKWSIKYTRSLASS